MIFKFNIVRNKSSNNLQIKVLIKDFNFFVSEDSPGIGQYVKVVTKEKSSDKYLFQICEIDNETVTLGLSMSIYNSYTTPPMLNNNPNYSAIIRFLNNITSFEKSTETEVKLFECMKTYV